MVKNLRTYLNYGKRFTSIWMDRDNESLTIYMAEGRLVNNEIEIFETFETRNIQELVKKTGKRKHAYLILTGSGILTKSIDSNIPNEKALAHTFPNIDSKLFYYTIHQQGDKKYVSVCRKSTLEDVLQKFETKGIYFTGISIDILSLSNILTNIPKKAIHPGKYQVGIGDDIIEEIIPDSSKKEVNPISIGNKKFTESFLVPIGAFGNYFSSCENSNLKILEKQRANLFKEKSLFGILLITGISVILGALLINFFFFSSYYKEIQILRENYQTELTRKSLLDKNREALAKSRLIASSVINSENSKVSFYLNRITADSPRSIVFNDIQFQPLLRNLKQDNVVEVDEKKIIIHGLSSDKEKFSEWLQGIQEYDWVSDINITDFNNNTTNHQSLFGIQLKIPNE